MNLVFSGNLLILHLSYKVTKPNTIAKLSQTSFLPFCCGFVYEVRSYAVCYRVLPTLNMNQDNYILISDRMSQTFIQALSVSCSNKTSAGVIIITKYCISHGNMYNSTTISLSREKQINWFHHHSYSNRIGGVMVSVPALGAVARGFEPRSCQTKNYKNWYLLLLR
jgi:hypothetical protein